MLYTVLAGSHTQDNVTYSVGDVVETNMNLIEMFGELKFKRAFELEMAAKMESSPTSAKKKKDSDVEDDVDEDDVDFVEPKEPTIDKVEPLGDDLTARFSVAKKNGYLVFKKGNKFTVAAGDKPGVALNKKGMKRSEVVKFIEGLIKKD